MSRWTPDRLEVDRYPEPGLDLPVLYGNLDTNGHLNNVELGRFFEHGRVALLGPTGLWKAVHKDGGSWLVVRVAIDYLKEVHLGQTLHVRSRMARAGTSSATTEQAAWVEGTCVALAEVVFAHGRGGASAPWSPPPRAILEGMLVRPQE
jgi:acyl-CoA thioester hydrolase